MPKLTDQTLLGRLKDTATNIHSRGPMIAAAMLNEAAEVVDALQLEVERLGRETEKAYRERNRLMVLAAVLALEVGQRAGRYRDPAATDERFAWIVQIEFGMGQQITIHVDAHDLASGWRLLPEIQRDWDGHDAEEAFARVSRVVECKLKQGGC